MVLARVLLLLCLLAVAGCCRKKSEAEPARGEAAGAAPEEEKALPPGAVSRFFPADGTGGFKRAVAVEVKGYTEMQFVRGKDKLTLTITDTREDPSAKAKFKSQAAQVDGYPYANLAGIKSALLVKDRFQLTVQSTSVNEEERKSWFRRFDIASMP